jgi:phosphohistidine phosphatase
MKTIYLLRHAKSEWADPGLKDHDRPLNDRGRDAAPRMGAYMRAKRYKPDLVLCSTARRTVATFELIKEAIGPDVPVKFEETLYLAEPRQLMERLQWIDEAAKSVLFIGHNPGIAQFALELCASPEDEAEEKISRRMRDKYSTGALAVLKMPAKTWREVTLGTGALKDFMRPKDL